MRAVVLALVLALVVPASAAQFVTVHSLNPPLSLAGEWKFQTGDDLTWSHADYDDSDWSTLKVPLTWVDQGYPDYAGIAWYRLTIKFSSVEEVPEDLALFLGEVHSAYELYVNGKLIGGVGSLPPNTSANYDKMATWQVPQSAMAGSRELVIALRVWGGGTRDHPWEGGAYEGDFLLGHYSDLVTHSLYTDVISLVLVFLYLFIGMYHLYLFRRHPELMNYLWFGLLAVDIGAYNFMTSQWDQAMGWSFLTQKKIEFGIVYVQPALWIQMISSFVGFRIPYWLRAYQISFLLFVIPIITVVNLNIHFLTLKYWQTWTLLLIVLMPLYVCWRALKGSSEARALALGLVIFGLTAMNDILIDLVHISTPHLVPYGFFAIILAMMISLANTFTRMYSYLEDEVEVRTLELREANRQLSEVSVTDPMTALLNRRGFSERVASELARSTRTGQQCSLLICDIDHFKQFNDQYGHACGDYVLIEVAKLFQRELRDVDIAGRWGGEEFVVLLPDTRKDGALVAAEKLRSAIEANDFNFEGQRHRVTITIGVAEVSSAEGFESSLQAADQSLYRGKDAGRNCVVAA